MRSNIIPVHHLSGTGSFVSDVILKDEQLFIRTIEYVPDLKAEHHILKADDYSGIPSQQVLNAIAAGTKYCKRLYPILNLDDLSIHSKQLLEILNPGESIDRNEIIKVLEIDEDELKMIHQQLVSEKQILSYKQYKHYLYNDRFGHLRKHFDPSKNHHFKT